MKTADLVRLHALPPTRSQVNWTDEPSPFGPDLFQFTSPGDRDDHRSQAQSASSDASRQGLAATLSEMRLDASEPSRAEKAQASAKATESEFGKWANMSPAEKIRASILEQHGLTEDSLKGLPEAEREAIEKEIEEAIKRHYGLKGQDGKGTAQADASAALQL